MSEYILREDAINAVFFDPLAANRLRSVPPADVVKRKGGQWFRTGDEFGETWMCSECCEEWAVEESVMDEFPQWAHYCPNCGADMRGEA